VARSNPYWDGVSGGRGGVSLGYRRTVRPPGVWIAKIVADSRRLEERIGHADDDGAASGGMTYRTAVAAALEWGRRQTATIEADAAAKGLSSVPTVRSAVESYIKVRIAKSKATGENAAGRLRRHVLSDTEFADTRLSGLNAKAIEAWRSRLPVRLEDEEEGANGKIAPATVNRLLNDLRAALNGAAERHRTMLPAAIMSEIRVGTRALSIETTARRQILSDDEVGKLVEVAFELQEDFGWLVLLLAITGARHSQLIALRVRDVQVEHGRIMIPGSKKGRAARAKPPVAFPVSVGSMKRLQPLLASRRSDETLLETWAYTEKGPFRWQKDHRRPWGHAWETDELWAEAKMRAEVDPETLRYAFRHSSIVRHLQRGLPVRLTAALHDTSSEMIEAHYSAFIVDASIELSRRAAIDL
jgi:integrase